MKARFARSAPFLCARSMDGDRRVLRLIRRYLEAGMLANGVATERHAAGRCRRYWRTYCSTK